MFDMESLKDLLVGSAAGAGLLGAFVVLIKLLFAREQAEYTRLEARIKTLETALVTEQAGHLSCIQQLGELRGKVTQLSLDLDLTIRRHDLRNDMQISANRRRIKALEDYLTANNLPIPSDELQVAPETDDDAIIQRNQGDGRS